MTLLELLSLLKQRIALVLALPLTCALMTAAYCWTVMPDQYTAETSIYALYKPSSEGGNKDADTMTQSDLSLSQMLANDFTELIKNDQLQQDTASSLGLKSLNDYKINVVSKTSTRVISVAVTGTDAESVALVANKLAEEIGKTAVRIMNVEAVNIISKAKVPTSPSGPQRLLYTAVAAMAGLFVAVALVVIMDMLDTTIRNDEEASQILGAPVIGRFPLDKGGRG